MDKTDLFQYQQDALPRILSSRRLIIGDEPGLGKTPMVLCAAAELLRGEPAARAVVICPASAVGVWKAMWPVWADDLRMMIFSYGEVLHRPAFMEAIAHDSTRLVILDEAHYLSNPEAKRTLLLLGPNSPVREKAYVWALTGTPMQRHAGQLYPLLRGLWPDDIQIKYARWKEAFCVVQKRRLNGKLVEHIKGSKNLDSLNAMLPAFILRRTYDDVGVELPEIVRTYTPVDIDIDDIPYDVPKYAPKFGDPSPLKRVGEIKAPYAVKAILEDIENGTVKRPLVFAWHTSVLDEVVKACNGQAIRVFRIDGSTPQKDRDFQVAAFQAMKEDEIGVFVAQIAAVETGVTLTNADRVELIESSWNHARDDQAIARAHRTGQKRPLLVRFWFLPASIDGAVLTKHMMQRQDRLQLSL